MAREDDTMLHKRARVIITNPIISATRPISRVDQRPRCCNLFRPTKTTTTPPTTATTPPTTTTTTTTHTTMARPGSKGPGAVSGAILLYFVALTWTLGDCDHLFQMYQYQEFIGQQRDNAFGPQQARLSAYHGGVETSDVKAIKLISHGADSVKSTFDAETNKVTQHSQHNFQNHNQTSDETRPMSNSSNSGADLLQLITLAKADQQHFNNNNNNNVAKSEQIATEKKNVTDEQKLITTARKIIISDNKYINNNNSDINNDNDNVDDTSNITTDKLVIQFPLYMRIIATIACIIIFTIGVTGNLLVPLVVIKTKDLRNSTNLFLINLSVADVLVLIVCMPTVLVELHSRPETWLLGEQMCKMTNFVEMLAAHGSILTILAISFERYYAICKPLKAGYKCTNVRAAIIICIVWFLAILLTSPIIAMAKLPETTYIDGSLVHNCILETKDYWPKTYVFVSMIAFFWLPLIVLMLVYWLIAKSLVVETSGNSNSIVPTMYHNHTNHDRHHHNTNNNHHRVSLGSEQNFTDDSANHSHDNHNYTANNNNGKLHESSSATLDNDNSHYHHEVRRESLLCRGSKRAHRLFRRINSAASSTINNSSIDRTSPVSPALIEDTTNITDDHLTEIGHPLEKTLGRNTMPVLSQQYIEIGNIDKTNNQIVLNGRKDNLIINNNLANNYNGGNNIKLDKCSKRPNLLMTIKDESTGSAGSLQTDITQTSNDDNTKMPRRHCVKDEMLKINQQQLLDGNNNSVDSESTNSDAIDIIKSIKRESQLETIENEDHPLLLSFSNDTATYYDHLQSSSGSGSKLLPQQSSDFEMEYPNRVSSQTDNCSNWTAPAITIATTDIAGIKQAQLVIRSDSSPLKGKNGIEALLIQKHDVPFKRDRTHAVNQVRGVSFDGINLYKDLEVHHYTSPKVSPATNFAINREQQQEKLGHQSPVTVTTYKCINLNEATNCCLRSPTIEQGKPFRSTICLNHFFKRFNKLKRNSINNATTTTTTATTTTTTTTNTTNSNNNTRDTLQSLSSKCKLPNDATMKHIEITEAVVADTTPPTSNKQPDATKISSLTYTTNGFMHLRDCHISNNTKSRGSHSSHDSHPPQHHHRSHSITNKQSRLSNFSNAMLYNNSQQMKSRRQVVVMLAFVVACFFLLFFPYRVFTIWLIFSTEDQVLSLGMETYYNLTYFSRILIYLHSAINPIAYNLISTKFRRAFIAILCCRDVNSRRKFTTEYKASNNSTNKSSTSTNYNRQCLSGSQRSHSIATTITTANNDN